MSLIQINRRGEASTSAVLAEALKISQFLKYPANLVATH